MTLIVQKYGGTSVGSVDCIENVADKVIQYRKQGHDLVIVVSAMSGETDRLINLAKSITPNPSLREYDALISTGEQCTIALLCIALEKKGQPARSYTGGQVKILTDNMHTKARIEAIDDQAIRADLDAGRVVVVAGFQGVTAQGDITTLGRGGSDTTAVALAAALKADECQIFTDVDGVYTTDPRIEPKARRLDQITFEEMLEMASLGSKILQIRSVEFAGKYNVPLRVLSTFQDGGGTLISYEDKKMEKALVSGIAFNKDEAQISVLGVPDRPGIAFNILAAVSQANIEVDMIVQNVSQDNTADFTFTVNRNDFEKSMIIVQEQAQQMQAREVSGDNKIIKLSLVGVGMRSHAGIASRMFQALAAEGINIRMISTSEIKISVVIDERYLELGVRTLHEAFELEKPLN